MLISITLAALVALTAVATALALLDSWIRGRFVFEGLKRESALLDAGFVPMARSGEQRLREPVRFDALAAFGRAPTRVPSQRLKADRKRATPRQLEHGAA
jgi:hypothetical protein